MSYGIVGFSDENAMLPVDGASTGFDNAGSATAPVAVNEPTGMVIFMAITSVGVWVSINVNSSVVPAPNNFVGV
jgi:hypothetical protein